MRSFLCQAFKRCICNRQVIKAIIFLLCSIMVFVLVNVVSDRVSENVFLSACLRWLWAPLLLILFTLSYGEPIRRYKQHKLFMRMGFWGVDGKLPRYIGQRTANKYLRKIRFKSKIPYARWEKAIPDIEMFEQKKIYKMEQSKKITVIDIYLIQENLPSYVEWRDEYLEDGRRFAIGESYMGKVIWNAAALPHGLIAGATGGGKTVLLRCIIHQAIAKKWNVKVFDFKGGGDYASVEQEAKKYQDLEEGYGPFSISDPEETRHILLALTIEVKRRLACFKELGVSNIDEYNEHNAIDREIFIPWLLVIDEAAEILDVRPKDKAEKELYAEIDHYLRTLARMSRAAGVHILMGFIRPDANVLDGQIKNNLLWRVCGYFADPAASRIVLDSDKATELPPEIKGRFIVGEEETQAYYLPIPTGNGESGEA